MGREILYVVDTDVGHVRVLEHGSSAAHAAGEAVNVGFSPDDSLVFDTASETPDARRAGASAGMTDRPASLSDAAAAAVPSRSTGRTAR